MEAIPRSASEWLLGLVAAIQLYEAFPWFDSRWFRDLAPSFPGLLVAPTGLDCILWLKVEVVVMPLATLTRPLLPKTCSTSWLPISKAVMNIAKG
jgi:hypothetical protein